ncbi:MAG: hypothetical protein ABJB66_08540 [Gemmatimonadaceae bacterium]
MTEGTTRTLWCVTLLDQLRQEGFDVGITQYLQVETLFDRVEAPLNPSDLKTLICPIVARSVEEQQRFGELFDAYLAAQKVNDYDEATVIAPLKLRPSQPSSPLSAPPAPRWTDRRSVRVALGAAFAIVFAVVSWFVARAITPCVGAECGQGAKKDSVVAPGKPDTTKGTAIAKPTLVVPAQSRVVSIHPSDTTRTAPTPSVWPERGLAFAVPLFLFALFARWRNYRKQAVAERTSASNAPFVWPIRIANAGNSLFAVADLASTARALRRRQPGNEVRLAIEPSVQATIHAFGFPTFRFSAVTRPSEYVMLIESSSARDNQARYFGALASRLEAEGAFITQYYFDRDPRVCYRESDGRSFKIVDLARQHSNDRLIVFSNGSPFLHPVRGTVQSWIDLFDTWSDRAILTPVPPRRWGAREVALRGCFLVLPATLEGLRAVADHFDAGTRPELSRWKERDRSTGKAITATAIEADELRAELGDDLFRWVAACSIYPELYWDLSAHLGELPAIASVFSESNALRLIQLSWFRDGAMPEKLRHALQLELKNLDASLTDTEALVRTSLIELLERDPISFETAAGEEQQRQLLLQRLYLYREDKLATDVVKRELESKFPTDELLQDVTVVRLLDRASNPLALKLSRAIRNGLWRGGHPAFATRTLAYGVVPVIVGVVLAAQIKAPGTKANTSTNAPQSVAVVPLYRSVQLPPSTAFELGAIGVDSTGTPITNATTAWSVNDTSLATVVPHDSGNSTLTTRATQSASTVQLSILNTRASMDVRVQSGVPAIVWTSAVIDSGVPTQIGATGRRTGWVSCRSDVADVASATGVVIGHLPGSTMLTRSLNSSDVKKVGGTAKASMFDFGFDKEVVRPGT